MFLMFLCSLCSKNNHFVKGASSVRQKRSNDIFQDVRDAIDGGLNDACFVNQDCDLDPVVYCDKDNALVGVVGTCKFTWWFILILVVVGLIIIGAVISCFCAPCCCLYECGKKLCCCS